MQNDVLFSILLNLLVKPRTAPELAQKNELSLRSVYRYIDTLESAGVPILRRSGCKGGFCIDSTHFIDKAYFTDGEYKLLLGLAQGVRLGGKTADSVADKLEALARLRAAEGYRIAPDTLVIDGDSWTGVGTGMIADLQRAIENCTAQKIEYTDASNTVTERTVLPHTLVLKSGLWYVYAYCRLRGDWRLFAVNRILSIVPIGAFERMNYDLDAVPWRTLPSVENEKITLRFAAGIRTALLDRFGGIAEDGVLEFSAPITQGLVHDILRFATEVTVLSPPELTERIRTTLAETLKQYE